MLRARLALVLCLLGGCRLGFDPLDAELPTNRSTIGVSAPSVAMCSALEITVTSRDVDGGVRATGGDDVVLALAGGTSEGEVSAVVDHRDGTYTARLLGTRAGTPVTVLATVNGEVAIEQAVVQVVTEDLPSSGLLIQLDAARVTGAGCANAGASWTDLEVGLIGTLSGIGDPCSGDSGWCGSGLPGDPFRLAFDGVDDVVDFGAAGRTTDFTIALWVRPGAGGMATTTGTAGIDLEPIVSKGAADVEELDKDTNYVVGLTAARLVGTDLERDPDSLNRPQLGNRAITNDAWRHLAVTFDRAMRTIYINGAVDAQMVLTDTPSSCTLSLLAVGSARRQSDLALRGRFRGDLAALQIYGRALTASEIHDACVAQVGRFAGASCL